MHPRSAGLRWGPAGVGPELLLARQGHGRAGLDRAEPCAAPRQFRRGGGAPRRAADRPRAGAAHQHLARPRAGGCREPLGRAAAAAGPPVRGGRQPLLLVAQAARHRCRHARLRPRHDRVPDGARIAARRGGLRMLRLRAHAGGVAGCGQRVVRRGDRRCAGREAAARIARGRIRSADGAAVPQPARADAAARPAFCVSARGRLCAAFRRRA